MGDTKKRAIDIVIKFLKGTLVGIGAILPGLSGGMLAVVFGIYEPIVAFIANFPRNFWKQAKYLLPIILGIFFGVVIFSGVVSTVFKTYPEIFTWLFIGFVFGTFPSLYRISGLKGRTKQDWAILVVFAIAIFMLMKWYQSIQSGTVQMQEGFGTWVLAGVIFGSGFVIPGLSPSNFLIYLGLYQPMSEHIKNLNMSVLIPLGIGALLVVLVCMRIISYLFKTYYAKIYHAIFGIVIGSSIAVLPIHVRGVQLVISLVAFVLGVIVAWCFNKLEDKYPHEPLF